MTWKRCVEAENMMAVLGRGEVLCRSMSIDDIDLIALVLR